MVGVVEEALQLVLSQRSCLHSEVGETFEMVYVDGWKYYLVPKTQMSFVEFV